MITEISTDRRPRRRILAGEFMVTPVKPLSLGVDGRSVELLRGRDRLAPDYWAVIEWPEWFRPADPRDRVTAREHRALLERASHKLGHRGPGPAKPTPRSRRAHGSESLAMAASGRRAHRSKWQTASSCANRIRSETSCDPWPGTICELTTKTIERLPFADEAANIR